MKKNVFDFQGYKPYLAAVIAAQPKDGHGFRAKLAEAIGVQRAFVSQVLQGDAHFNLEHGDRINTFLNHSQMECHYFLLLIQYNRAGTENLRHYFRAQMQEVLQKRLIIKNRLGPTDDTLLNTEDRQRYYSSWLYGAIRVALSVPKLRTREALVQKLKISSDQLNEILDFLVSRGLVRQEGDHFFATAMHLHLPADSPLIAQYHNNWRLRTMQSFDRRGVRDVHYSSVVSLSESDALALKKLAVDFIEQIQGRVESTAPETLCTFCLDFFEL